jgi:hypothetical protein
MAVAIIPVTAATPIIDSRRNLVSKLYSLYQPLLLSFYLDASAELFGQGLVYNATTGSKFK